MSSLVVGFVARMHKQVASAQGETTLSFEVLGGKRLKRSGLSDKVHRSPTIVTLDSPEQASDAQLDLEGSAQAASREACASFEDGALVGGLLHADQVVSEASFVETAVGPLPLARRSSLATSEARKARLLDRLVLGFNVKSMELASPLADTSAPGPNVAWSIIDCWNPFNKRDSSITRMRELYPNKF